MIRSGSKIPRCAAVVLLASIRLAWAADFSLTIGNPVAADFPATKGAAMLVRMDGCGDLAKARITGTAEGLVKGSRRSVPLRLVALPRPGIHAVNREWPAEGVWVIRLNADCLAAVAGAIVPVGPQGFLRESTKLLARSPSESEVDAALKELAAKQAETISGGKK